MSIIYSQSGGLHNAAIGKLETPLKMIIEHESDYQKKRGGVCDWLFNVERSQRFGETIVGQNEFDVFSATEEGAAAEGDGIEETFRAYIKIISLVIELIRQFYSEKRVFRIVGESGEREYLEFSGDSVKDDDGRHAYFDIEVSAKKKSPSEAAQKNELARALYEAGAFKRENAKETLMMLELMDFEGVDSLKATIRSLYGGERE